MAAVGRPLAVSSSSFAANYFEARDRFRRAAEQRAATLFSLSLGADLTLDVATWGAPGGPTLVVSSGLHGVEGLYGSAVQCAWMESSRCTSPVRFVFLHALNPFGFAHGRRVDSENIDLNRNFLLEGEHFTGAPEGYVQLDALLNPPGPPVRDGFLWQSLVHILRSGLTPLKEAVAGGQYRYPRGLFFGGNGPSELSKQMPLILSECRLAGPLTVHLDLHTGLGTSGRAQLLVAGDEAEWFQETFGRRRVERAGKGGTAYPVRGLWGAWLQSQRLQGDYRFAVVEVGTHGILRVLHALRRENQAHHYAGAHSAAYRTAKSELWECFCPEAPRWRRRALREGLEVLRQAEAAVISARP